MHKGKQRTHKKQITHADRQEIGKFRELVIATAGQGEEKFRSEYARLYGTTIYESAAQKGVK